MSEVAGTEAPKPEGAEPVAPADENVAQPGELGTEGTDAGTQGTEQETPEKRESRSRRRFNRERDRRIAAETELRLLKEAQPQKQPEQRQEVSNDQVDPNAPTREQFASYEDFLRADARYTAKREATAAAREVLEGANRRQTETQTQAARQKEGEAWEKQMDAARDEIEDFDDVLKEAGDTVCLPDMRRAILESDHGARITYYLAQHPEEAERIAKLKPSRQAAEIIALESKVAKPAKAPSKAPAPITPVGKSADAGQALDTRDPKAAEELSTSEWIKRDQERMAKAGIRM